MPSLSVFRTYNDFTTHNSPFTILFREIYNVPDLIIEFFGGVLESLQGGVLGAGPKRRPRIRTQCPDPLMNQPSYLDKTLPGRQRFAGRIDRHQGVAVLAHQVEVLVDGVLPALVGRKSVGCSQPDDQFPGGANDLDAICGCRR